MIKISDNLLEFGTGGRRRLLAEHLGEDFGKVAVALTLEALALLDHCVRELERCQGRILLFFLLGLWVFADLLLFTWLHEVLFANVFYPEWPRLRDIRLIPIRPKLRPKYRFVHIRYHIWRLDEREGKTRTRHEVNVLLFCGLFGVCQGLLLLTPRF